MTLPAIEVMKDPRRWLDVTEQRDAFEEVEDLRVHCGGCEESAIFPTASSHCYSTNCTTKVHLQSHLLIYISDYNGFQLPNTDIGQSRGTSVSVDN